MDQHNPIIKLCVAGMTAEGDGQHERARMLFLQAWENSTTDFERCTSAHYVARHQTTPEDTLHWNLESLLYANAVGDASVSAFYPSLYLNIAHSYEQLGNHVEAKLYYELAAEMCDVLGDDPYSMKIRAGVEAGMERVNNVDSK
ncbi:MAG: hypothetical protein WBJ75_12690 [Pseudohongiellaceae bacterium]|nr:MAG: hypothetical protein A3H44_12580 [Gammaproteobacteria bacterium RIFCSPLOWO2_02_FULL_57_10]